MKHVSEDQLILHFYREGEAASRREIEQHLGACASCRASYEALRQILEAVDAVAAPERPEHYEEEVWKRLRPRLLPLRQPRWGTWLQPQRWALAGAMAAVLVVSFLAGRYWQGRQTPRSIGALPAQARERILLVAVGDHLERSQMLLIELEHADGKGPVDIATEKRRAEDLVASNRLYRQTAARAGDAGLASALDELERVLLQIAHSPSELTPAEFEQIQRRIEAQGILFKVRVIRSQVREKQLASARDVARRTS
jgi:CTP:molybdopterin cytidylyltransferase MocA